MRRLSPPLPHSRPSDPDSVWVLGTVVDTSGTPILGAEVFVEPGAGPVLTDSDGAFALRAAAGPSLVIVRRLGFSAFVSDVDLVAGRDRRFRIEMRPAAFALEAVETRARSAEYRPPGMPAIMEDFHYRRATGRGYTFTREEFERVGGVRGVLATVPGVRPGSSGTRLLTGIQISRCPPDSRGTESVAWFVDGMRVMSIPEYMDTEIEAIEIYRGASQLPPDAVGNACAAVYIWLRRAP